MWEPGRRRGRGPGPPSVGRVSVVVRNVRVGEGTGKGAGNGTRVGAGGVVEGTRQDLGRSGKRYSVSLLEDSTASYRR